MIDLSKAGYKTSEFLTAASVAASGIFTILGSFLVLLQSIHDAFPSAAWVSGMMAIVGGIMAVGASLGFSKARAVTKAADAQVQIENIRAGNTVIPAQGMPANPSPPSP